MTDRLTKSRLSGALTAWRLAIESKIRKLSGASMEELASQYGAMVSNDSDLVRVAECFDWDKVMELLEEVDDGS